MKGDTEGKKRRHSAMSRADSGDDMEEIGALLAKGVKLGKWLTYPENGNVHSRSLSGSNGSPLNGSSSNGHASGNSGLYRITPSHSEEVA
jgi:hypothetical protein